MSTPLYNRPPLVSDLPSLVALAFQASALSLSDLPDDEAAIVSSALSDHPDYSGLIPTALSILASGSDVFGEDYCSLKSPALRRSHGATFTPSDIISNMLDWASLHPHPSLVVDPGAGTARFAIQAAKRFPRARVVAIEIDPVLRLLARATAKLSGCSVEIMAGSFLDFDMPEVAGRTLFLGNPPYVRHHDVSPSDKEAFFRRCERLSVKSSKLAGLHIHFLMKVFECASPGDLCSFITSSEWMDTSYGRGLRDYLSTGEHSVRIDAYPKTRTVFPDALSSAAIAYIEIAKPSNELIINQLGMTDDIPPIPSVTTLPCSTWRDTSRDPALPNLISDFFDVSRGAVTGMNEVWIHSDSAPPLPDRFLIPCVTSAEDISRLPAPHVLSDVSSLSRLISLPHDLSSLTETESSMVEAFLIWARELGAADTYTAKHRRTWWTVSYREPPPIIMTYMGRRPPVFALNRSRVPFLNIAHGLYPKTDISEDVLIKLISWLNSNVPMSAGRSYAGGLVKFEPSEVSRIHIPSMDSFS